MDRRYTSSRFVVAVNNGSVVLIAVLAAALAVAALRADGDAGVERLTRWALGLAAGVSVGILAPLAYVLAKMAHEVRVKEDSVIEFRGPFLKVSLTPSVITSVRGHPWMRNNMVEFRHPGGRVRLYMPVDGFYEFLGWLKQKNPNVEIRWL